MDDDGHLFDPDEYLIAGKIPRRPRRKRKRTDVETVPVRTDERWRFLAMTTPGVLHARGVLKPGVVSSLAACGSPALPHSFDDGQLANGCRRCFAEVEPSATEPQDENRGDMTDADTIPMRSPYTRCGSGIGRVVLTNGQDVVRCVCGAYCYNRPRREAALEDDYCGCVRV